MVKFLRTGWKKYSRLGLRRKKKQVYRKSKGGENKIRLKMKGHIRNVSIGFRTNKKERGLVKGLKSVLVYNIDDLKKISKDEIGIIGKIGDKSKKKIAEYAKEHKIKLFNLNPEKFLQKIEEKIKMKKELKEKRIEKKKFSEKKTKKEKIDKKGKETETTQNKETMVGPSDNALKGNNKDKREENKNESKE